MNHILNTIFHAAVWRSFHGITPGSAALIAVAVIVVGLAFNRGMK